jgi:hypothetical protein
MARALRRKLISMVQAAESWKGNNGDGLTSLFSRLPLGGRLFVEAEVHTIVVIVGNVIAK